MPGTSSLSLAKVRAGPVPATHQRSALCSARGAPSCPGAGAEGASRGGRGGGGDLAGDVNNACGGCSFASTSARIHLRYGSST